MIPETESSIDIRRKKLCIASNENKGGFVKMLDEENTTFNEDDDDRLTLEELAEGLDAFM